MTGSGGGAEAQNITLIGSSVSKNTAHSGGGLDADVVTVSHSTIDGNLAIGFNGGAIVADEVQFTNATLTENSSFNGGAVTFQVRLTATNTTFMTNGQSAINGPGHALVFIDSIVGGAGPLCSNAGTLMGTNVISGTECGSGGVLIQTDPLLGPLQNNGGPTWTMAPLPGSPAIGAASACLPTDQRGALRVVPCDVGAYETGATPTLASLTPATMEALGPDFTLSVNGTGFISGTVLLWNGSPRPTIVHSPTLITAAIPAADLASVGLVTVQARYLALTDSVSNGLLFMVTKADQVMSFLQPENRTLADPPLGLTATASSGLPVAFSVSGPGSIVGATMTATAIGTCTITATQPGNATYLPATPVMRSFAVTPAPVGGKVITLPAVGKDRAIG